MCVCACARVCDNLDNARKNISVTVLTEHHYDCLFFLYNWRKTEKMGCCIWVLAAKAAQPKIHNLSSAVCVFALIFVSWGCWGVQNQLRTEDPGAVTAAYMSHIPRWFNPAHKPTNPLYLQ